MCFGIVNFASYNHKKDGAVSKKTNTGCEPTANSYEATPSETLSKQGLQIGIFLGSIVFILFLIIEVARLLFQLNR